MTWLSLMQTFDPTIQEEVASYLLMERTAYPFSDVRMTVYQLRRAIRVANNQVQCCECCGMKSPFHTRICPLQGGQGWE